MRAIEIETEFQKQVADGLPYDSQISFLQKQLEKERASSFSSKAIIEELTKRVADTKRLKRFSNYRTKYQELLGELKAGRSNAQEQLGQLKGLLGTATDDEDLRLEIMADITAMEAEVKAAEDAMVQNQLKRAQYDGTERVLSEAIELVKSKRSSALLEGLNDEAASYDTWLTVLNKQLNETRVVNSLNDIDVKVNTKGLGSLGKVDALNDLIRKADSSTAITIDGVTYDSTREYWTNTRDSYLAGNGTGNFTDFFKEMDGEYTERINAAVKRDGLVTTVVFDRIKNEFSDIKNRGEFKPFLERVENYEALTQGAALASTAQSIIDRVQITGDYKGADQALLSYAQKYNVNVDSYRLTLSAQAEQRAAQIYEASDGTISMQQAREKLGVSNILTPEDPGFKTPNPAETTPADPTKPESQNAMAGATSQFAAAAGYGGGSVVDFLKMAGADSSYSARAALAAERGITNYTGSATQNTQLLGMLKTEANTKPAATPKPATPTPAPSPTTPQPSQPSNTPKPSTPAPTPAPSQPTAPKPSTPSTPAPAPKPSTPAPAPAPTPAPAPKPAVYSGASIVDYLNSVGRASDYNTRAGLAKSNGITNYTGTADQNTQLLKKLRGF